MFLSLYIQKLMSSWRRFYKKTKIRWSERKKQQFLKCLSTSSSYRYANFVIQVVVVTIVWSIIETIKLTKESIIFWEGSLWSISPICTSYGRRQGNSCVACHGVRLLSIGKCITLIRSILQFWKRFICSFVMSLSSPPFQNFIKLFASIWSYGRIYISISIFIKIK